MYILCLQRQTNKCMHIGSIYSEIGQATPSLLWDLFIIIIEYNNNKIIASMSEVITDIYRHTDTAQTHRHRQSTNTDTLSVEFLIHFSHVSICYLLLL